MIAGAVLLSVKDLMDWGGSRARRLDAITTTVVFLLCACATSSGAVMTRPAVGSDVKLWILNAAATSKLQESDPAVFQRVLRPASLFILQQPASVTPAGSAVADFKSYAAFSQAITARTIPPGVRWVMYDNESWPQTPVDEQKDPGRYEALFAALAHRNGFKVILAPAQDLVFGLRQSGVRAIGAAWQRYLSLHLAAISARLADAYEIQAQSDELTQFRSDSVYQAFVTAAAAQARAANPGVMIFAGLSTQRVTSAAQLDQDYKSTRSLVDGYWLNIPGLDQPGPLALAEQFLAGSRSSTSVNVAS